MKVSNTQTRKANELLELHRGDEILVLLNAWDVASARIFAASGARAVGTTSMGVAATAGYGEPEQIPLERIFAAVASMARAVDVPLTADMERGYGATTDEVVASIGGAIDCGAAGINIEDGTGDPTRPLDERQVLVERVSAIRAASEVRGLHLVINARTDVFLRSVGSPAERLRATIERGNAYRQAGADCIFVPGGLERETIRELVREIDAPLNVVANPAISIPVVPPVPELQELGVARVSVGAGAMRSTLALQRRIAEEVLGEGTYSAMQNELDAPGALDAYRAALGLAPE